MLSRLRSAANPESGTIQYTYDANGNLSSKTDARGVATVYTYDRLNRVTARGYSDSTPAVAYFYDNLANAKGKLIKVSSSVSSTEYTAFDILGRVTAHRQTTNGTAYNTAYSYNLSGALIEETYPSGRKVKNTLDAADGDLSLVETQASGGAWQTRAGSFAYNPAGAVTSMQLGNGRWESTVFNSRLQPTRIALGTTQHATDLLKLEYGYGTSDNNGNVVEQKITVPGVAHPFVQTYAYDLLNPLKSAEEKSNNATTWKQTFTYDRYGNRNFDAAGTTTLGSCSTAVCNPTISAANNRFNAGQGYAYDPTGNTTADAEGRTFVYDAENKQVSVSNSGGTIGQYHYDGDGKRVKKTASTGDDTVFVYDAAGKLVEERAASSGALQTSYVYAGSRLLSTETSSGTSYLTNDQLGSPRINTNGSGTVTARHDYHPFGEEIARTGYGLDSIRKQFTGYERDAETGLDFAQARNYASTLGRFNSIDPENYGASIFDPQTWNAYVYVVNNPTNYIDPDGLEYLICPTTGSCYTHNDDDVRKAKKAGGFGWVGGRDSSTGLDSGTIYNEDGSVAGTYQQTSHDSPIQQMLWGAQPTLRVWKPVVDHVFTAMVSFGGVPVASAVGPSTSIIRSAAPTAAQAAQVAKSAQLAVNGAKGAIGEAQVLAKLAADGVEVVGTQVSAKLASGSRRVIDILVKVGDEVVAIEVKTGGAKRGMAQIAKDAEMLSNGATLVGKKAGELSGSFYESIRTIVVQLP